MEMISAPLNILYDVHQCMDVEKHKSKISYKVWNWLQQDYLRAIILDRGVWYYEINSSCSMPAYVKNYLRRFMAREYYAQYLYDLDI